MSPKKTLRRPSTVSHELSVRQQPHNTLTPWCESATMTPMMRMKCTGKRRACRRHCRNSKSGSGFEFCFLVQLRSRFQLQCQRLQIKLYRRTASGNPGKRGEGHCLACTGTASQAMSNSSCALHGSCCVCFPCPCHCHASRCGCCQPPLPGMGEEPPPH